MINFVLLFAAHSRFARAAAGDVLCGGVRMRSISRSTSAVAP